MTSTTMNEKGLALTRCVTTDTLVASFESTDELMEQGDLTSSQYAELSTARGWIIEVLEERGELDRILAAS